MDPAERLFAAERPRLVGLAYRILGSRIDAEDVVQDAWFRLGRVDLDTIERPEAWLTTVVSRLALDQLKSARLRRESYVGPWLPEPVRTPDADGDPSEAAVMTETLTTGFLRLLEQLSPVERVVLILADVFRLPHPEIASVVDRTPEATRQIASRARRRVRDDRPVRHGRDPDAEQVVEELLTALLSGEVDRAIQLVADDAVLISDGGADHRAARRPVLGAERVVRFSANIARRLADYAQGAEVTMERTTINAEPGLIVRIGGRYFLAGTFTIADGRVSRLHLMRNPDKLAALDRSGELV